MDDKRLAVVGYDIGIPAEVDVITFTLEILEDPFADVPHSVLSPTFGIDCDVAERFYIALGEAIHRLREMQPSSGDQPH